MASLMYDGQVNFIIFIFLEIHQGDIFCISHFTKLLVLQQCYKVCKL